MNPTDFAEGTPWAINPRAMDNLISNYTNFRANPVEGMDAFRKINFTDEDEDKGYIVNAGVAVIPVNGPLSKRGGFFTWLFGGSSYSGITAAFDNAVKDTDVGAIVLDIDSPGGTVAGTEALADMIFGSRGGKPIVAFANGMMASAAYWIGSAADVIVGGKTSEVGSIGVLMVHEDWSRADEQMGLKVTYLTAGKYKALGNAHEALGVEGREILQDELNQIYSVFVDTVARNRDVEVETVLSDQADGRVFIGQQAKDKGLIDVIGTLDLAVELARSSIGNLKIIVGGKAMDLKIETLSDLRAAFPEMCDQIVSETKAEVGLEAAVATAKADEAGRLLGLVDTFLGAEKAKSFRAVVESGVTPEQFAAINALNPKSEDDDDGPVTKKMMLDAIKSAGADNVGTGGGAGQDKDYMALVEAHIKENKCTKSAAMRAITAKFPEKHEEYIRKVNTKAGSGA